MMCRDCHTEGTMKPGTTTYMQDYGDCIVIVKNVPAIVCEQCGYELFTAEVAERLQELTDRAHMPDTEVVVVKYTQTVAA